MDEIDTQTILNNIDKLVEATEFELLIEKLQNSELFSNIMVENIQNEDDVTQHKNLLIKITQQGPNAFAVFKEICETHFTEAAEILKQRPEQANDKQCWSTSTAEQHYEGKITAALTSCFSGASSSDVNDNNIQLELYDGPISRQLNVKHATKFCMTSLPGIETYQMRSKHRGVLFLVNIIDFHDNEDRRNGAEADKDSLLDLFNQMGFKLFYYENLSSGQFQSLIRQLSSSNYLKTADCLVLGLLTHGRCDGQTTFVDFSDKKIFPTEKIVQEFSNTNCKYLQGKPKIFIYPCCRGDVPDKGQIMYRPSSASIEYDNGPFATVNIPVRLGTFSDMFICYATLPGYRSHRNPDNGSWYIQGLCRVFAKHAHDKTFDDLMKYLELEVSTKNMEYETMQTSSVESRGSCKVLYFNPGYYNTQESDPNGNFITNKGSEATGDG